ncbi:hypothetical protein TNCV_2446191 [Trichonephila clavipes]|nr:hypothetical protein TNCV_2446191 [Trichonephila clavipes]
MGALCVFRRAVATGIGGKRRHIVNAFLFDTEDPQLRNSFPAIRETSGMSHVCRQGRYECPKCGKNMVLRERKGTIDGYEWRYRTKGGENPHDVCKSIRKEREEKLRFEQLRLDEQKRKDEFELEKLRIQTPSKLGADTSKESDTKFLVKEVSKFDLKEDIRLYLKLFERQA